MLTKVISSEPTLDLIDINIIHQRKEISASVEFNKIEISKLADSIKINGMVQPIVLRKQDNSYEIVAGEIRWMASKIAGLKHVPAFIKTFDEKEITMISLIESLQYKKLTLIEESIIFKRLLTDFDITQQKLSTIVGKPRSYVINVLQLLELHEKVQEMIANNSLHINYARFLLNIQHNLQLALALEIVEKKLSLKEVEFRVNNVRSSQHLLEEELLKLVKTPRVDTDKLEYLMSKKLGMMAKIKHVKNEQVVLILKYDSLLKLENLLNAFS